MAWLWLWPVTSFSAAVVLAVLKGNAAWADPRWDRRRTPLRPTQELLGHADIRVTIHDSHLSPKHLREAVEVVGAAEKSNRLRVAWAPDEKAKVASGPKSVEENWLPQQDSNPRRGLRGARGSATRPPLT